MHMLNILLPVVQPKKSIVQLSELVQWGLHLRIGSTSEPLIRISFHLLNNNDKKKQKCYGHKEWVLLSITSKNFWEINSNNDT